MVCCILNEIVIHSGDFKNFNFLQSSEPLHNSFVNSEFSTVHLEGGKHKLFYSQIQIPNLKYFELINSEIIQNGIIFKRMI